MKKIPDNAKMVFHGLLHDVYQWDQELFDGSTAIFECIKRGDSVSVLAVIDGQILITQEQQPGKDSFVGLPGGRVEKDESQITAARRELLEETGYAAENVVEWFVEDPAKMSKFEWNVYYFIATNCKKVTEAEPDPGEKIESKLISFDELLQMRNEIGFKGGDLVSLLEKASQDETEREKLKTLLGLSTNN